MFPFKSKRRKKPVSQLKAAQAGGVSLTHRTASVFVPLRPSPDRTGPTPSGRAICFLDPCT